jgi:virginiamycin B lyase
VGIAAGPDGALWFTQSRGRKIGRITTGGAITEYDLPPPSGAPGSITTGPDGALWFVVSRGESGEQDSIGRLQPHLAAAAPPCPVPPGLPRTGGGPLAASVSSVAAPPRPADRESD